MRAALNGLRAGSLAALALALAAGVGAQSKTGSSTAPASTPAAQPAPGTTPVGGDTAATGTASQSSPGTAQAGTNTPSRTTCACGAWGNCVAQTAPAHLVTPAAQPAPGTTPAGGDTPGSKPAPGTTPVGGDTPATATDVNPEKVIEPGSQAVKVKPGSIDDVNAVGNRDIGARGMGNWYSVDTEIKMGKELFRWRSRRAPSSLPTR